MLPFIAYPCVARAHSPDNEITLQIEPNGL